MGGTLFLIKTVKALFCSVATLCVVYKCSANRLFENLWIRNCLKVVFTYVRGKVRTRSIADLYKTGRDFCTSGVKHFADERRFESSIAFTSTYASI